MCVGPAAAANLSAKAKNNARGTLNDPVNQQEEQRRDRGENQHHDGGNGSLAACRPSYFASSERTSRKNFMSYPTKNIDADIQMAASLEPVSPYVGVRYAKVKG